MVKHRYAIIASAGLCALGCAWMVVRLGMRVMRTTSCTVIGDQRFCPEQQGAMRGWISKNFFTKPFHATQQEFYRTYPAVASIKRSYKSWGHASVKITARPLGLVCNQAYGITHDKKIVNACVYNKDYIYHIPKLVVKEEKNIMQDQGVLLEFIHKIPHKIKQSYALVWHDPTRIELNHEGGNVRALIMYTTDITPALCTALETFVQQGKKVQVDLRYKGQIVLGRVRS